VPSGEKNQCECAREERVAVAEQEVAEPGHDLTAISPQKLYHLKNAST
jgi:hypothetical protein